MRVLSQRQALKICTIPSTLQLDRNGAAKHTTCTGTVYLSCWFIETSVSCQFSDVVTRSLPDSLMDWQERSELFFAVPERVSPAEREKHKEKEKEREEEKQ